MSLPLSLRSLPHPSQPPTALAANPSCKRLLLLRQRVVCQVAGADLPRPVTAPRCVHEYSRVLGVEAVQRVAVQYASVFQTVLCSAQAGRVSGQLSCWSLGHPVSFPCATGCSQQRPLWLMAVQLEGPSVHVRPVRPMLKTIVPVMLSPRPPDQLYVSPTKAGRLCRKQWCGRFDRMA